MIIKERHYDNDWKGSDVATPYEGEFPNAGQLRHEFSKKIKIDAVENNCSDVTLHVAVWDNAGNYTEKTVKMDIDVTKPTIEVSYDNNECKEKEGKFYFNANRVATITITERTNHFDREVAIKGITIAAKDAKGKDVDAKLDEKLKAAKWVTNEKVVDGVRHPDEDTHTLVIPYDVDANYQFEITYTDFAGNTCPGAEYGESVAPEQFTVDTTEPTGSITIDGFTWTTLLEVLTFGLWKDDSTKVTVTASADDLTSPVIVEYYKTDKKTIMSKTELDNLDEKNWTQYNVIDIGAYERFTVYLRITDYAGNYTYVSSGGYIVDPNATKTDNIKITLSDPVVAPTFDAEGNVIDLPIYNDDIVATIEVSEQQDENDTDYSGIRKVVYWIMDNEGDPRYPQPTAEEIDAKKELLYSFEFIRDDTTEDETGNLTEDNINIGTLVIKERDFDDDGNGEIVERSYAGDYPKQEDLKKDFVNKVRISAKDHDWSNVTLHVGVWDNANNYSENVVKMDIDVTRPSISVSYKDEKPSNQDHEGYFPDVRTATIVITERTNHFVPESANAGITIEAVDANQKPVCIKAEKVGIGDGKYVINVVAGEEGKNSNKLNLLDLADAWYFKEYVDEETQVPVPNKDTHTLKICYATDANYTFKIGYTDRADNKNSGVQYGKSVAPEKFTIDTVMPNATILFEQRTWDELLTTLTFGIWRQEKFTLGAEWTDETSPIHSAEFYKEHHKEDKEPEKNPKKILTAEELDALTGVWETWPLDNVTDGNLEHGMEKKIDEDETFTMYLKIVDYAGNVRYVCSDGLILDTAKPGMDRLAPTIGFSADASADIYNSDVSVDFSVADPLNNDSCSGLRTVTYEVINMGSVTQTETFTLTSYDGVSEEGAPTYEDIMKARTFSKTIKVSSAMNNSNDVTIRVTAVDNAGNRNERFEKIKIDVTKPKINVSYDNNDGDVTFADGTTDAYFKDARTATIVVTERNFDPSRFVLKVTNTDDVIPTLSGWTTNQAGGNGDGTTHTATITYAADGDYTFECSLIDQAGNQNEAVEFGNSLAPQKFTVDRTAPKITITYDNNDARNGNYYKLMRSATVTIEEHNFETSRIRVAMTATNDGAAVALPQVSNWSHYGDRHVAVINFSNDALYSLDVDYNDKAGNASADMEPHRFYVDKTMPVLKIEGIVDESANNASGNIGFVMTATDVNFDEFKPTVKATLRDGEGFVVKELKVGTTGDVKNGKTYTVKNLEADGIYRVECVLTDKAGNEYVQVLLTNKNGKEYAENRKAGDALVTFSVNRQGSTYELGDKTKALVEKYYVRNVTEDVVLIEVNADPLTDKKVTVNGRELTAGTDYVVTESGGKGKWYRYEYSVKSSVFAGEGEYVVVCSSKDKANNDAFNDVKGVNAKFVVDRTAPVVTVTGLSDTGRYQTESQTVTIVPTDDGGALKSVTVSLVGRDGSVISDLLKLEGEALEKMLEQGNGMLNFQVPEGLYQNVKIKAEDMAGSDEEDPNTYDQTIVNVSVTPNGFLIFWANRPLRFGVIGGLAAFVALFIFLLVWKKKKGQRR